MPEPKYHLKVELDEKDYELLLAIKEHYNIKNNTEVVRIAIKDSYRIMLEREKILKGLVKKQEID